jgi:hypothetical protein
MIDLSDYRNLIRDKIVSRHFPDYESVDILDKFTWRVNGTCIQIQWIDNLSEIPIYNGILYCVYDVNSTGIPDEILLARYLPSKKYILSLEMFNTLIPHIYSEFDILFEFFICCPELVSKFGPWIGGSVYDHEIGTPFSYVISVEVGIEPIPIYFMFAEYYNISLTVDAQYGFHGTMDSRSYIIYLEGDAPIYKNESYMMNWTQFIKFMEKVLNSGSEKDFTAKEITS